MASQDKGAAVTATAASILVLNLCCNSTALSFTPLPHCLLQALKVLTAMMDATGASMEDCRAMLSLCQGDPNR